MSSNKIDPSDDPRTYTTKVPPYFYKKRTTDGYATSTLAWGALGGVWGESIMKRKIKYEQICQRLECEAEVC